MKLKIFIFTLQFLLSIKLSTSAVLTCSGSDKIICEISDFKGSEQEIDELLKIIKENGEKSEKASILKFVNSHFEKLPTKLCWKFTNIEEISITSVGLTVLHGIDLKGFKNLRIIHAESNKLTQLPPDIFDFTPKIYQLYFGKNQIMDMDIGSFVNLDNLKELDLSSNKCINKYFKVSSNRGIATMSMEIIKNCQRLLPAVDKKKKRTILTSAMVVRYLKCKQKKKHKKIKVRKVKKNSKQIKELKAIIKKHTELFKAQEEKLLIEYFNVLQKHIEKLQSKGNNDLAKITAKIKDLQIQLQKEMKEKYKNAVKKKIEELMGATKGSSSSSGKGVKIPWKSVHLPKIKFPEYKIENSPNGKMVIHVIGGGKLEKIFNGVKNGGGKIIENVDEFGIDLGVEEVKGKKLTEEEIETRAKVIKMRIEGFYTKKLEKYIQHLKKSGRYSQKEIEVKAADKYKEYQIKVMKKLEEILKKKFPNKSTKWCEKIANSAKLPDIHTLMPVTDTGVAETDLTTIPKGTIAAELNLVIERIFKDIKVEYEKSHKNNAAKMKFEKSLRELEGKYKVPSHKFKNYEQEIKKVLEIYIVRLKKQGNFDKIGIKKQVEIVKKKLVNGVVLKFEYIISPDIREFVKKICAKTDDSHVQIIKIPEIPKFEFPPVKTFEFPDIKMPDMPKFPEFPKFEIFKLPEIKIIDGGKMETAVIDSGVTDKEKEQINKVIEKEIKECRKEREAEKISKSEREIYEQKIKELEEKLKKESAAFEKIRVGLVERCVKLLKEYNQMIQAKKSKESEMKAQLEVMKKKLELILKKNFKKVVKQNIVRCMSTTTTHIETKITIEQGNFEFPSLESLVQSKLGDEDEESL